MKNKTYKSKATYTPRRPKAGATSKASPKKSTSARVVPKTDATKTTIRLNKFIALSGLASRRKADEYIRFGKVRINGKVIREPGMQIQPGKDSVFLKNQKVSTPHDFVYLMFNKPPQVVSTMNDPEGRPTVRDFFTKIKISIFPVGRLDWESEGLMLLTNDGSFAQQVAHPKSNIAKTYLVKLSGQPSDEQLQKLVNGVSIIGGRKSALLARKMDARGSEKYDWVKVIINDSNNKQIRNMFAKVGFDVKKLQRIAIGSLNLSNLEKGHFLILGPNEIQKIFTLPKELRVEEKLRDTSRGLHERVK